MPETTPYFDSITSARSMLLNEEEQLEGATTISLETCSDLAEDDILSFISDNFDQFLKTLRYLKKEDQELLLSYYLLSKMLDVDTPIPTPDGWKRNGDIVDGDWVLDDKGKPTRVLKAHLAHYPDVTYEIVLDTGEKIYAGNEHLWCTTTFNDRQAAMRRKTHRLNTKVRTTQEMYDTQRCPARDITDKTIANHHIAIASPLELPDAPLPLDPYYFGVWLGNGNSDCEIITSHQDDAQDILKEMGVIKNKHIPLVYLRSSIPQRLALLQGLMDSAGECTKGGYCRFSNCSPAIIAGMDELLWSLGIKHQFRLHKSSRIYKDKGRLSDSWETLFTTTLPCFRLVKKLNKQKTTITSKEVCNHQIVKINKVAPRLMRCLTVDSPSHLYLCGKSMCPTHNTQNTLAIIHKSTQTVCSFRLRMAVKTLGTFMLVGGEPTEKLLHEVLEKAGLENSLEKVPLSKVIIEYTRCRNFQQVALHFGLHRPDIRRAMSRASKALMYSKDGREAAVAAWTHSLIDKVSPIGSGFSRRKSQKLGHIYMRSSEILGQFRVNIQDPDFGEYFVSRANR